MKIIIIILCVVLVAFIGVQLFALKSQHNIETYPYTVSKTFEKFEIRNYEASLFTSVNSNTKDFKNASSKGFSVLAGYIFGGNEKNEKIAMTSPVAMSLEESMTMMFLVPKKFNRKNLPKPNASNIEFLEIPEKKVAAISFGGWANNEKIALQKQRLIKELNNKGIKHTNKFYYLGYNAPYEVFNRKNDIIVELKNN
tara:strand:+ start:475 stop:1065 length:591 start_codon:yes stop_codon:yes gene_type:complete